MVEEDGSTHSVIFINSNAQEFETFPLPGLVYRTIGKEYTDVPRSRTKQIIVILQEVF